MENSAEEHSDDECSDNESCDMLVDEEPQTYHSSNKHGQNDDEFQLNENEQKISVLETVNILLNKLQISGLNSSDMQNSQAVIGKIDFLSSQLKKIFIKEYEEIETEKQSEFELKLIEDIKQKFNKAPRYAEKLTVLTLLPES